MAQRLILSAPQQLALEAYDDQPLQAHEVRLQTLYSGISTGTELTAYYGSSPHLHKRWDTDRRLFVASEQQTVDYPVTTWGYEEVGRVIACGPEVTTVKENQLVYGAWGHRTHHNVDEDYAQHRLLPPELDPMLGIFSHIGATALNGVHDARIRIGETVAVFGLGVLGQIVAQLAKRSGAYVIGVDLQESRLALASELKAIDMAINARTGSAAEQIKAATGNRGADVSIEVTGAAPALNEAIRATAYSSKVVAMGFYQGGANALLLGEEFHHNRINLVCSQISGVAAEASYRWDRIRLGQTIMRLQAEGSLNLKPLITHIVPFERALAAFDPIIQTPTQTLQVVIDFT
ncbi:MAG: zinc-binding dehydrogenase [Anaerolineae bacterium]|nr:zinc-binding dehydrogenase [Anaerolineae bacterium]